MEEQARLVAFEEELKQGAADVQVQVEGAVHELELPDPAVEEPLQMLEQPVERGLPHGNVERAETELACERAAARRLHIDDPVRDVVIGIQIVGQGELAELRE